jgi:hypothetical protein
MKKQLPYNNLATLLMLTSTLIIIYRLLLKVLAP